MEFAVVIVCVIVNTSVAVELRLFPEVTVIWPVAVRVVDGLPVRVADDDPDLLMEVDSEEETDAFCVFERDVEDESVVEEVWLLELVILCVDV